MSLSSRYSSCYYRCATNFLELRKREVRRIHQREGWVLGKPKSNSGKEKELLREGRDPPHHYHSQRR